MLVFKERDQIESDLLFKEHCLPIIPDESKGGPIKEYLLNISLILLIVPSIKIALASKCGAREVPKKSLSLWCLHFFDCITSIIGDVGK